MLKNVTPKSSVSPIQLKNTRRSSAWIASRPITTAKLLTMSTDVPSVASGRLSTSCAALNASGWSILKAMKVPISAPKNMTSEARKAHMPSLRGSRCARKRPCHSISGKWAMRSSPKSVSGTPTTSSSGAIRPMTTSVAPAPTISGAMLGGGR